MKINRYAVTLLRSTVNNVSCCATLQKWQCGRSVAKVLKEWSTLTQINGWLMVNNSPLTVDYGQWTVGYGRVLRETQDSSDTSQLVLFGKISSTHGPTSRCFPNLRDIPSPNLGKSSHNETAATPTISDLIRGSRGHKFSWRPAKWP